ncbi:MULTISPECIES: AAA family ATPase [unclassified Streptomyces]|uniref:AAA family ATPase n=1 Tax=unclassified Streptomyces TaxID=2593676 RepID=UPI0009A0F7C3|nr:AAA family ATPase [Streptomyces sp. CB02058]
MISKLRRKEISSAGAPRALENEVTVLFTVLDYKQSPTPNQDGAFLIKDSWDDYTHVTTFELYVRRDDGRLLQAGFVRIGHVDMQTDPDFRVTASRLPSQFEALPEGYFSLAHQDTYYEVLNTLPEPVRRDVLTSLRDVAFLPDLIPQVEALTVFRQSLTRGIDRTELERLCQIAGGRKRILPYEWSYTAPVADPGSVPPTLDFRAVPGSRPSTNLHVLIGRNGVGKSHLLRDLARRVTAGEIEVSRSADTGDLTNCVAVSFSAFDKLYDQQPSGPTARPFTYIGLQILDEPANVAAGEHEPQVRLKTEHELAMEFVESFYICRIGARGQRWQKAIETLSYSASGFLDEHRDRIESLMRSDDHEDVVETLIDIFLSLSSGHRIALLIVTRLIETVTEKTLVLIDEPETHLHPPLLSALIRTLTDLFTDRNGMAIMATHSPVVLQEIPASCVYKLRRFGNVLTAEHPERETYGENLGELTHEIFGLEAAATGYHATLTELVEQDLPYEEIVAQFTSLGSEARAVLRAMTVLRSRERRA